jgi:hypothetical protein
MSGPLAITTAVPSSGGGGARFAQTIGNGVATVFTVTHNLGSRDVTVQIYRVSGGAECISDVTRFSDNVVLVGITPAPATDQFRVVVKY